MNDLETHTGLTFGRLTARLVLLALATLSTTTIFGAEPPRVVARVVKLKHLAVILPKGVLADPLGNLGPDPSVEEKEASRSEENEPPGMGMSIPGEMGELLSASTSSPEEWTPTVQQVAAAEKAILHRLGELAKNRRTVHMIHGAKINPHAEYVIQYCGIVLKKKKWIQCRIIDIKVLREYAVNLPKNFAIILNKVFTAPLIIADCHMIFDAYYEPATDKLLLPSGMLRSEPDEPTDRDKNAPPPKDPMDEDPFK